MSLSSGMDPIDHFARYLSTTTSLTKAEISLVCSRFRSERLRNETRIVCQGPPLDLGNAPLVQALPKGRWNASATGP
jgi:hypothetical protein